jgi:hypothetical protein
MQSRLTECENTLADNLTIRSITVKGADLSIVNNVGLEGATVTRHENAGFYWVDLAACGYHDLNNGPLPVLIYGAEQANQADWAMCTYGIAPAFTEQTRFLVYSLYNGTGYDCTYPQDGFTVLVLRGPTT